MENKKYTDYPFTSNGVNFISRIYSNTEMAKRISMIPTAIFQQINDEAIRDCIGDASKLSPAELLTELERVNEGGRSAFILLGAN